jgi:hypothetical protein
MGLAADGWGHTGERTGVGWACSRWVGVRGNQHGQEGQQVDGGYRGYRTK